MPIPTAEIVPEIAAAAKKVFDPSKYSVSMRDLSPAGFLRQTEGKSNVKEIPGYKRVRYDWKNYKGNPNSKVHSKLKDPPVPKLGFLDTHTAQFRKTFKKNDPIDKLLMIGNTIAPLINVLPKTSNLRNNTKRAISAAQVASLLKDILLHEPVRQDPIQILKRITWAILPSFDMMANSPMKTAIAGFMMGTNAIYTLSNGKNGFLRLNTVDQVRKLADDFLGNLADLLPNGDLKNSLYLFHRGIHTAAFFQNRKKLNGLDGPDSEPTLRALNNVFKFLPDGDTKSSLRSIIGGLRTVALIKNPW